MPNHDVQTSEKPEDVELTQEQAERVERCAILLSDHLYAQPEEGPDDDADWKTTSEINKRIFRSAALEIDRMYNP